MFAILTHVVVIALLSWTTGVQTALMFRNPVIEARKWNRLAALAFLVAILSNAIAIGMKVQSLLPPEHP